MRYQMNVRDKDIEAIDRQRRVKALHDYFIVVKQNVLKETVSEKYDRIHDRQKKS